jgi:hypothetical protein
MPSNQTELNIRTVFRDEFVLQTRVTMRIDKQRVQTSVPQNGDKRSGIERRRFSYHVHIPERRSGQDRRGEGERREFAAESYNEIAVG